MALVRAHADNPNLSEIGKAVIKAVERHAQDVRFADDLTILLARRTETRDFRLRLGPTSQASARQAGFGIRDSGMEDRDSEDDVPPIPGSEETRPSCERGNPAPNPEPLIPDP
jgi:hypothetical protein